MTLVLTPRPHRTECISGYLHRLAQVNGYDRVSWITEGYRRGDHVDHHRRITPDDLQEIADLSLEQATRLCVLPAKEGSRVTTRLLGKELHVSEVDMKSFRICPLCVETHQRHEALWHLSLIRWCPIHRVRLVDVCDACRRPTLWSRPRLDRCRCGAKLSAAREAQCSIAMADLSTVMRCVLYDSRAKWAFPSSMKHLLGLDLYTLTRLVRVMCMVAAGPDPSTGRKETTQCTDEDLLSVATALSNWPVNFRLFLKSRYENQLSRNVSEQSFRDIFDWAFRKLGINLRERGGNLDFIREEIYRFGAQYWNRDRLFRGSRSKLMKVENRWGSVPEAARILGIDPRTLLKRIDEGGIPVKRTVMEKRNRNFMVDLTWAREWRLTEAPSVGVREAARSLGITLSLMKKLRAEGTFPVVFHTVRKNCYSKEDVDSFRATLQRIVSFYSVDGTIDGIVDEGRRFYDCDTLRLKAHMIDHLVESLPD